MLNQDSIVTPLTGRSQQQYFDLVLQRSFWLLTMAKFAPFFWIRKMLVQQWRWKKNADVVDASAKREQTLFAALYCERRAMLKGR